MLSCDANQTRTVRLFVEVSVIAQLDLGILILRSGCESLEVQKSVTQVIFDDFKYLILLRFVTFTKLAGQPVLGRTTFLNPNSKPYVVEILEFPHTKPWKEKTFLVQKYVTEGRSIAQIARETLSSRAAIRRALIGFGIKRRPHGKPGLRPAQVPYGYRKSNGLMVAHLAEQRVLSVVQKMVDKGMSLRQVCDFLTDIGVPTKRRGQRWHPEMVRRLIGRNACPG